MHLKIRKLKRKNGKRSFFDACTVFLSLLSGVYNIIDSQCPHRENSDVLI